MKRLDYRAALRAKGIKPIPRYELLRTSKQDGDHELCSGGVVHIHQERK
jgi:hypothetical protein